jgi:DNA-binding response OmpR family regulator
MKLTKILIIDDTKSILDVLKDVFEFEDFKVYIETNSQLGIDSAKNNIPDLIICDHCYPKVGN